MIANLHVLDSFDSRDYLLDLAANQSGSLGLSIDFDMYSEEIGGTTFARCAAIDAVTVVDTPAANPTGLFRVGSGAPAFSPSLFRNVSTMPNLKTNSTATGFAARIASLEKDGRTGTAILKAKAADPKGFNEWCAAGRPNASAPTAGRGAFSAAETGFSARIAKLMQAGACRGEAIMTARSQDPHGFKAWCSAGAITFAARIKAQRGQGASAGKAILLAKSLDPAGFNAWNEAGRPE